MNGMRDPVEIACLALECVKEAKASPGRLRESSLRIAVEKFAECQLSHLETVDSSAFKKAPKPESVPVSTPEKTTGLMPPQPLGRLISVRDIVEQAGLRGVSLRSVSGVVKQVCSVFL